MYYFKLLLILVWFAASSVVVSAFSFFRRERLNSNRDFCRTFSWGVRTIANIQIRVEGRQHLSESRAFVYVANHQSALDVAIFGSLFPSRTLVVGKKEVVWIPFFNLIFFCGGNVFLDRSSRGRAVSMMRKVAETLRESRTSVWIFPEGTRNGTQEGLLPFKRGAFHLAIETGLPIIPIVSSALAPIIGQSRGFTGGGRVTLRVLPPISTAGLEAADAKKLSQLTREQMAKALREISPITI